MQFKHRHSACQALALTLLLSPLASAAEIFISDKNPKQGQTIEVRLAQSEVSNPIIEFNKTNYQTFPIDKPADGSNGGIQYQALIGIPADIKPGSYRLKVGSNEQIIKIAAGKFPVQRLSLPKKVVELKPSPGEMEAVQKAKETLSNQRQWSNNFLIPSAARVSTQFGLRRIVNGKMLSDYFHSGIDYAGGLGSPVRATAPGTVIMAVNGFKLHGNIVAIDHGQGVVSFYLHLNKILVKQGDTVKAGQMIGKIGQTGRANGPHLHFSLYVNQVATNPSNWYNHAF